MCGNVPSDDRILVWQLSYGDVNDMTRHTPDSLTGEIRLRDVTISDLPIFFDYQLDPDANYMAAFTAKDPTDRDAFMAHWQKILNDENSTIKTILFDGHVAGNV